MSSYELGAVYLQLCEMLYLTENRNYEKLVDPSIYIPRFSNGKYVFLSSLNSFLYCLMLNVLLFYFFSCFEHQLRNKHLYRAVLNPAYSLHHTLAALLKGKQDKEVMRTARDIIASMKRDWIQV